MRNPEFARVFSDKNFSVMVDYLNSLFTEGVTLSDNFSGEIITVEIPSGTEIQIPHRLKAVPKYRIILRQNANAVIYDGLEIWNEKYITLNASATVIVTLLLMRS